MSKTIIKSGDNIFAAASYDENDQDQFVATFRALIDGNFDTDNEPVTLEWTVAGETCQKQYGDLIHAINDTLVESFVYSGRMVYQASPFLTGHDASIEMNLLPALLTDRLRLSFQLTDQSAARIFKALRAKWTVVSAIYSAWGKTGLFRQGSKTMYSTWSNPAEFYEPKYCQYHTQDPVVAGQIMQRAFTLAYGEQACYVLTAYAAMALHHFHYSSQRPRWAVSFASAKHGCFKSRYGDLILSLVGEYGLSLDPTALKDKFSGVNNNAHVCLLEEFSVGHKDSHSEWGKLKKRFVSPAREFRPMNRDAIQVQNTQFWIINTNRPQDLPYEASERRMYHVPCLRSAFVDAAQDPHYAETDMLYDQLENSLPAVNEYLHTVYQAMMQVAPYDGTESRVDYKGVPMDNMWLDDPYQVACRKDLGNAQMSTQQHEIANIVDGCGVISAQILQEQCDKYNIKLQGKELTYALEQLNFTTTQRIPVRVDGKVINIPIHIHKDSPLADKSRYSHADATKDLFCWVTKHVTIQDDYTTGTQGQNYAKAIIRKGDCNGWTGAERSIPEPEYCDNPF